MVRFLSTSKTLRSFVSRKGDLRQLIRSSNGHLDHPFRYRTRTASSSPFMGPLCNNINNSIQTRQFLGCGDGEEGILSKIYEEKRVLGYSQEQLFDVVAAVDLYHGFVPWCQRSETLKQYPDGSFDAELEIGFKFLVESYVSHVELNRPKLIKVFNLH
ncbi:START-like domain superfamily [Sesbania bispinosa]|nr:START-like domain superfamily [Sesbania bispinosa]